MTTAQQIIGVRIDRRALVDALWPHRYWLPIGAISVVIVWLIVSPVLSAEFGVVDDHEIVRILGPDRHLPVAELPAALVQWLDFDVHRFRPLRWVLRLMEAAVWGWNPTGWYIDRLLLALVTVIATGLLVSRYTTRPIAVLAGVLVFVGLQSESWFRLGPQEAYAVPLYMSGLAAIVHRRTGIGLALVVLAALTKEAFVPMAALAVAGAWDLGHRRGAAIGAVAVVAVALAVVLTTIAEGEPFSQVRSIETVSEEWRWMAGESAMVTLWPLFAIILAFLDKRLAVAALGLGTVIMLPQAVLDAEIMAARYMLPAALGAVLVTIAGLAAMARRWPRLALVATYAMVLVVLPSAFVQAQTSHRWAEETRAFQADVAAVREALAARAGSVLVVRPSDLRDFESLISFRVYLSEGTAMFLPPPLGEGEGAYAMQLYNSMVARSEDGGFGYSAWRQPEVCVEAAFRREPETSVCDIVLVLTGWVAH